MSGSCIDQRNTGGNVILTFEVNDTYLEVMDRVVSKYQVRVIDLGFFPSRSTDVFTVESWDIELDLVARHVGKDHDIVRDTLVVNLSKSSVNKESWLSS